MTEGQNNEENGWDNEAELHMVDVCPLFTAPDSWYQDLVHYLQEGYFPKHWSSKQRRALHLKSASYQIIDGVLFRNNYDGVFLRCLDPSVHKILRAGYYWPTLFKDAHAHVRKCDAC